MRWPGFRIGSAVGIALFVTLTTLLLGMPSASATGSCTWATGSAEYQYVGEQTNNSYFEGIEGKIGDDGVTTGDNSNDHALALVDAQNYSNNDCDQGDPKTENCFIQIGDGIGHIGDDTTMTLGVYNEVQDRDSYEVGWDTSLDLDSTNYFSDFWTGIYNEDDTEIAWYGYVTSHDDTVTHYGTGWFLVADSINMAETAATEAWASDTHATCPDYPEFQKFGENGDGTVTADSAVDLSTDGVNWNEWTDSQDGSTAPLQASSPYYNDDDTPNFKDNYYGWWMDGDGS